MRMTIMYMRNASIVPEAYVSAVKHLGIRVGIPSHSSLFLTSLSHTHVSYGHRNNMQGQ